MGILRAVGGKNSSWRHRLAIDRFDDAHLVGANLNQGKLADDLLEGPLDQMKSGLEHIGLYADFAFGCHDAAWRHLRAQVAALFDRDLTRADVDQYPPQDYE